MSLKQKLSDVFTNLRDAFEKATRSPLPEPEIQKEMEQEGWKFEFYTAASAVRYGAMGASVTFVTAPNGDAAYNNWPTAAQREFFNKTVAEKRAARGLKP
jgi:hypothetical protein